MYFLLFLVPLIVSSEAEEIICPPRNFAIRHMNDTLVVYEKFIKISFDKNLLRVFLEPTRNRDVKLTLNNTYVSFLGHTTYENNKSKRNKNVLESLAFKANIVGTARLSNHSSNFYLSDCDLYLLKNLRALDEVPLKVKIEILHQAAACLRTFWCESPNSNISYSHLDVKGNDHAQDMYKSMAPSVRNVDHKDNFKTSGALQALINKLVDAGIKKVSEVAMTIGKEGYLKVPNIEEDFSTGRYFWKTNGKLEVGNGTFGNLSTLARTNDVEISHRDLEFTASCGIGLSKVNITFQNYRLRYGLLKFAGNISVIIEGISVSAKIFVNYKDYPCKMGLSKLDVNILGDTKVAVTGLGYLNKMTSRVASWVIKKSEDFIVNGGEKTVRRVVTEKVLSKIDCEQFRP